MSDPKNRDSENQSENAGPAKKHVKKLSVKPEHKAGATPKCGATPECASPKCGATPECATPKCGATPECASPKCGSDPTK